MAGPSALRLFGLLLVAAVISLPAASAQTCTENKWSLSYTAGWWRQQYCNTLAGNSADVNTQWTQGPSCSNASPPPSACSLAVPQFSSLAQNLQDLLLATTQCSFTPSAATSAVTRFEICQCLKSAPVQNNPAYVLNMLLGVQPPTNITVPSKPSGCSSSTFKPVADSYVCSRPGKTCPCPGGLISLWPATAINSQQLYECRNFVARAVDDPGKCLSATWDDPAESAQALNCTIQACPCGGSSEEGLLPLAPSPSPAPVTSPSPAPVPSPSPQPPTPETCSAPQLYIDDLSASVRTAATMWLQYGGGVNGYFRQYITGCDPASPLCQMSTYLGADGIYENGYCVDTSRPIDPRVNYSVQAFSSYTNVAEVKCPTMTNTALGAGFSADILRRLNWMLNTYFNTAVGGTDVCTLDQEVPAGYAQNVNNTSPGTYGPITAKDMQSAVWTLTGNWRFGGNQDTVNCLVWNAMHANVTASYTPPCGGTMAVILVPCTFKSNELGWTWQVVNAQITIANVPVQCSCQAPSPSPSPQPGSSPSPLPESSPSPAPPASPSPAPESSPSPAPPASPSPAPDSSPSPAPESSPSPAPEASPSPAPEASPSPAPESSPSPAPPASPSPAPPASPSPTPPTSPSPLPSVCIGDDGWVLTYPQEFWLVDYCQRINMCASGSSLTACNMDVPPTLSALTNEHPNWAAILSSTAPTCSFGATGNLTNQMCGCLATGNVTAGTSVALVFNLLLGRAGDPAGQPDAPSTCSDRFYPTFGVGGTFVCAPPGSNSPCPCPQSAITNWGPFVSQECQAFVSNAAINGTCMPSTASLSPLASVCQLQNCDCIGQSELPSPTPSPSPAPLASPSPAPESSPSPAPPASPSPAPPASPSPAPPASPSPAPPASPSPAPPASPSPAPPASPSPAPPASPSPAPVPSPSPAPVPSPSPQPPTPENCTAPLSYIQALSDSVRTAAVLNLAYGPGVVGYFRDLITNCNPPSPLCTMSTYGGVNGTYENGYCIDTTRDIDPRVDYNVSAFSSYSDISAMMCPGMWRTPMDPYVTPNIMRRLNWMLNTYYNPGVDGAVNCTLTDTVSPPFAQSQVTTVPGTYGPIRAADMQSAVWTLTGQSRYGGNANVVNCLVYNAVNAYVPADYTPPCGGTMAVVLMPCKRKWVPDEETYIVTVDKQITITNVPVDCECAAPSPAPTPSPSPAPESSPAPIVSPSPAPGSSPSPAPPASPSPAPESSPSPNAMPYESPSPAPESSPSPAPPASPSPAPPASPSPAPESSPSPAPESSPSPAPVPSPSPSPEPSPSPSPSPTPEEPVELPSPVPSPSPAPIPPTTCDPNAKTWSLSYTQGWWQESFCNRKASCASANPPSACGLIVPGFNSLTPAQQDTLVKAAPSLCPFTATSSGTTTQNEICQCLNNTSGAAGNNMAQVLNTLLLTVSVSNPAVPTTCLGTGASAGYKPVANVYVCTRPNSPASSPCPCPQTTVGNWNGSVINACRNFVANVMDPVNGNGQCLPKNLSGVVGVDPVATCQIQSCPCADTPSEIPPPGTPSPSPSPKPSPSPSPSPKPSPSPSPKPSPSPSPKPSPSPSPKPSPSPSPKPSPSPSPKPSPSPSPAPAEIPPPTCNTGANAYWALSYSPGGWTSFCGMKGPCASSDPLQREPRCNVQVPGFTNLPKALQDVLKAAAAADGANCPFTTTTRDSAVTKEQICDCIAKGKGQTDQRMAHVLNTLLGGVDVRKSNAGNAPTNCAKATYKPVAESYVCTKSGSTDKSCGCPSNLAVKDWPGTVSPDCMEFVVNTAHEPGKCMSPQLDDVLPNCQLQSCPCSGSSSGLSNTLVQWQPIDGATAPNTVLASSDVIQTAANDAVLGRRNPGRRRRITPATQPTVVTPSSVP